MKAIIYKEISSFFSSPIGYLVIGVFLVMNGLFLWVFNGDFNIFDAGFASLDSFFLLAPWVLLFLVPAVTMKSFSEEKKMGTLELLVTKPISLQNIVLGKYIGVLALILIAVVPTFLYIITISRLGNPPGNLDIGSTIGSYVGLLFLILAYTAIGIFASTLSNNQIVAFIVAILLCFIFYYAFDALAILLNSYAIASFGMKAHFDSVARGILDTRDVLYFLSVTVFFLFCTVFNLKKEV
ncbi:gliding motility-associated ABC transporter permease subunit GldF [Patiriisocius hiemis]|uniref:Gliding motility-associated ABC transporter permease subunit GldF n=1 Tax=Patiriisocius hiemis TaxID=3075604 RepID=A0ABU2YFL3_9FLAO|nr:gliding motility-associated ABC transporter permease subunit GldF [Constantimarinum sp. W242]MDT0556661.1 gliding motility-associated ABC transporter permease subunit GldF [Constantimarinum sp. W242]